MLTISKIPTLSYVFVRPATQLLTNLMWPSEVVLVYC